MSSPVSAPAPASTKDGAQPPDFEIIIHMLRQVITDGRSPMLQKIHTQAAQRLVQFRVAHPSPANHRDAGRVEQAFRLAEELIHAMAREAASKRTQHA